MENPDRDLSQEMKEVGAKFNERNQEITDEIARKLGQTAPIEVTKDIEGEE